MLSLPGRSLEVLFTSSVKMLPRYDDTHAEAFLKDLQTFLEVSPHETHTDLQECRSALANGDRQTVERIAELLGTAAGRDGKKDQDRTYL